MRPLGFTLVEMVVAITISAILMGTIAMLIGRPVEAYAEQSRRNELIDASDRIHRMLGNDLSKALPNSVRIQNFGNTQVLQMLEVTDVLYYQEELTPAQADVGLDVAGDTRFQAYGSYTLNPTTLLVVNDTAGAAYGNAGVIASVATPAAPQPLGAHTINFFPAFTFTNGPSPTNRIFAIRAPITYVCNLTSGRLTRFANHARDTQIPVDESAAQLNSADAQSSVVATGLTACALQCAALNGNRCQQTLTFSATIERGAAPDIDRVLVNRNYRVENTT
jgi:MSHA biogenesis protein MshO